MAERQNRRPQVKDDAKLEQQKKDRRELTNKLVAELKELGSEFSFNDVSNTFYTNKFNYEATLKEMSAPGFIPWTRVDNRKPATRDNHRSGKVMLFFGSQETAPEEKKAEPKKEEPKVVEPVKVEVAEKPVEKVEKKQPKEKKPKQEKPKKEEVAKAAPVEAVDEDLFVDEPMKVEAKPAVVAPVAAPVAVAQPVAQPMMVPMQMVQQPMQMPQMQYYPQMMPGQIMMGADGKYYQVCFQPMQMPVQPVQQFMQYVPVQQAWQPAK
ncbi:Hypothetical_protein [Hexamita inflata]|uniref:Hypothetical_protein n=1 Tax=Hexamita inflata TaxID=28002 RepID=A0AA86Q5A6_9EUKA|nr:Hypothetical protein HINF_LOCUS34015 [Hexamita inflata]CAI9976896.1 Hypothetical protein HINF_LOCUS64541 [Hexamita inflata]